MVSQSLSLLLLKSNFRELHTSYQPRMHDFFMIAGQRGSSYSIALVPLSLLLCLLVWRLWRFTVLPMLHPNDPKELPYWMPCT